MHGIENPRAKIRWAKHHLAELEREREMWVNSHPYAVFNNSNADKTFWKFLVHRFDEDVKPESDTFGLIIGDYVHNLRSALDQLAWQLVKVANGITPKRDGDVSFPIVDGHPRDFWSRPMIAREEVTFEQALFLEGFQPYRAIGPIRPHPLTDLHALWNADKHKLITDVRATVHANGPVFKYTDTRLIENEWDSKVPLEGDTQIAWARVEVTGPDPNVVVEYLPVDVAVGEGGRLIQDLPNLLSIVEDIVENCIRFFP
jgi:hypothetical protein